MINRYETREIAFQTLFAINANPDVDTQALMESLAATPGEEVALPEYLLSLVAGVREQTTQLDAAISEHLSANWSLTRLAKTDLIILRVAVYEMLEVPEVPAKVAVNEALELAKKYSDERSRKFINGVLSAIVRQHELV
ncbi:transcription antitermination factor NusB [Loigolactobacillus zhaoyuanensis]|uniref:Transcription antitermination protein NusB n=1 Tax=Loigolactobacillus zhaoyuanensis TaxID=2486017 RepID=A0ABW8U905_9LACO|nr:transcription antitermination factor NusB [Loigolactobacillus zhaoyuanensis]